MREIPFDASEDTWTECPKIRRITRFSSHARLRSARRNVARNAAEYVLIHGRSIQRTGVMFVFLGWRDIPWEDRCDSRVARLAGTILIVAEDGSIVTLYRNSRGWRTICRKMKYRLATDDFDTLVDVAMPAAERASA